MRILPPEPAPGDKITAELVRELIRCIRERQILKGSDYTISSGPNGTTIKIKPGAGKKQGEGGEVDHDTLYYADEKSIQNAPFSGSGSTHVVESNAFELKGFGRFDRNQTGEAGLFIASSELELGTEAMSGASVLVRFGDTDTVNGNTLGYVKLKLPESIKSPPTPFQYVEEPDEEHQGATIKSIVNCTFYFDGELKTLPDFSNVPLTGTVYLTCTKAAPESGSSTEPQWQFAVATSPAQTPTGGNAINIKLYDFSGGKMTMDYRTTFLTLCSNENETIEPDDVSTEFIPDAAPGATPDGDEGKLQIKGFKAGSPSDTNTLPAYLQGAAQLPSNGMFLVARTVSSGGVASLVYIPLGKIFQDQGGDISVEFVRDNDWDSTYHVLRKRLQVLNLRTGAVTDKAGTTYANGWEIMAQTTPISSLLPSNSAS